MKKGRNLLPSILAVFLGLSFSSCLKLDSAHTSLHADSVEYRIFTIVRTEDGGPGASIQIDSLYVSGGPGTSADSINYYSKQAASFETGGYEAFTDTFISQYEQAYEEYPDMFAPWEFEMKMQVSLNESGVFSLSLNFYEFTGGAHPNSWTQFLNFDLETGKPLRLEEIFTRSEIKELNERAEKIFRETYDIDPETSLDEAGYWFDNDKFSLNTNFLVQKKSLVFIFNPYEIAPYVAGPSEVEIPYSQIEDLIGEENPLKKLI
ncbi:DUF3298 and DUF4163 domain-containing protein [candidate division WOR-3 bacterium]|nr:DUF3298 and DUF4163 domain-containing protein [candidate division WOR-3 bacterium]